MKSLSTLKMLAMMSLMSGDLMSGESINPEPQLRSYNKTPLTRKQQKSRAKSKQSRKQKRNNR